MLKKRFAKAMRSVTHVEFEISLTHQNPPENTFGAAVLKFEINLTHQIS